MDLKSCSKCGKIHPRGFKCNIGRIYTKTDDDEIWGDDVEALKTAIASVKAINKIKEEVDKLTVYHTTAQGSELLSKNAVIRLINKHLEESEG